MGESLFSATDKIKDAFQGTVVRSPPEYKLWRREKNRQGHLSGDKKAQAFDHLPDFTAVVWPKRQVKPPGDFDSARYYAEIKTNDPDKTETIILDVRPHQRTALEHLDRAIAARHDCRVDLTGKLDVQRWIEPTTGRHRCALVVLVVSCLYLPALYRGG